MTTHRTQCASKVVLVYLCSPLSLQDWGPITNLLHPTYLLHTTVPRNITSRPSHTKETYNVLQRWDDPQTSDPPHSQCDWHRITAHHNCQGEDKTLTRYGVQPQRSQAVPRDVCCACDHKRRLPRAPQPCAVPYKYCWTRYHISWYDAKPQRSPQVPRCLDYHDFHDTCMQVVAQSAAAPSIADAFNPHRSWIHQRASLLYEL